MAHDFLRDPTEFAGVAHANAQRCSGSWHRLLKEWRDREDPTDVTHQRQSPSMNRSRCTGSSRSKPFVGGSCARRFTASASSEPPSPAVKDRTPAASASSSSSLIGSPLGPAIVTRNVALGDNGVGHGRLLFDLCRDRCRVKPLGAANRPKGSRYRLPRCARTIAGNDSASDHPKARRSATNAPCHAGRRVWMAHGSSCMAKASRHRSEPDCAGIKNP
jgi:hypothetical protein